jgi:hypothetical protein
MRESGESGPPKRPLVVDEPAEEQVPAAGGGEEGAVEEEAAHLLEENSNHVDKAQEMIVSYEGNFDMSSVALPEIGEEVDYPGHKQSRDGDAVSQTGKLTVQEAVGRHGKPLRSRLFEVGFMFKPELSTGHNFICCVPVLDEATGEMRPCNAVLKIPKGSLGNPFRHLKNKHPEAYKCIMDNKRNSSKGKVGSAPSKKKRKVAKEEAAVAAMGATGSGSGSGSGEEELPVQGVQKLSKKLLGKKQMLRKCVIFCCMELLPLDEINKEGFKYFLPNIYSNASTEKSTVSLYKILKSERTQLTNFMQERLEEAEGFYRGMPFVHVSVSPEVFSAGPLVRLLFINAKGKRMEMNLLGNSTDLVDACRNHSYLKENISVVTSQILSLGHHYQLEIKAQAIASVSFEGSTAWATADVDIGLLEEYLHPNKKSTTSSEWVSKELQKYAKAYNKESGTNLVLSKEIDVYEGLKQQMATSTTAEQMPTTAEEGGKESTTTAGFWQSHSKEVPLLFTAACSLKYGSSEFKMQEQTEREKAIIQDNGFLSEGLNKIVKPMDVPFYIESVLLIKYNASMLL